MPLAERGAPLYDLFAEDAAPPLLDAAQAPTDQATRRLATAARTLAMAEWRLKRAEELCERIRERRNRLAIKVLPELMDAAGQDHVGLPNMGVDVVVQPHCTAAIRADWPEERREAAFAHLEALGAGHLVRATVTVDFSRDELNVARTLREAVNEWLFRERHQAVVNLSMAVHWKTLTSWLTSHLASERERDPHEGPRNTPNVDLEQLGAVVGRVCRVVPRKKERQPRGRGKRG